MRWVRTHTSHWGGSWYSHGMLVGKLYLAWEHRGKQAMGRFGAG